MTTPDTSRAPAFPPGRWVDQSADYPPEVWAVLQAICRPLTELPPIEDTAMQATYPAAQARVHTAHLCRTPIDPVTAVRSPGLQKGNSDLQPATWNPPAWLKPLIGAAE